MEMLVANIGPAVMELRSEKGGSNDGTLGRFGKFFHSWTGTRPVIHRSVTTTRIRLLASASVLLSSNFFYLSYFSPGPDNSVFIPGTR
jgi:hypothetical protein